MKKTSLSPVLIILCFFALFSLFSSFIVHHNASNEMMNTIQQATTNKHNLLKNSLLAFGALGGAALLRHKVRRFRRHGEGIGCLGVFGIIGLILLGLIALPFLLLGLIIAGIAALFGAGFRRPRLHRTMRRRW